MSSRYPRVNENIVNLFSTIAGYAKEKGQKVLDATGQDAFPWWGAVLLFCMAIGLYIWYLSYTTKLETPANIRSILMESQTAGQSYTTNAVNRKGLQAYLELLKSQNVPTTDFALTNFVLSTVNATGFFGSSKNGAFSPDAVRLAVQGGARAFVLDIWPDLTAGSDFAPILQAIDTGSNWRRISLNTIPFKVALDTLIQQVYPQTFGPASNGDFVVLYLRFRGTPRPSTFNAVAAALNSTMERYRMDSSFNGCRGQDRIFKVPITELYKKVLIVSNVRASESALRDYINIGPLDGIHTEWLPSDLIQLTDAMRREQSVKIQQNLSFVMKSLDTEDWAKNDWNWRKCLDVGVQFPAMNFFNKNDELTAYMSPDMFGVFSYKIKPASLRYRIELLPRPGVPSDPRWGTGDTAGTPVIPDPIRGVQ